MSPPKYVDLRFTPDELGLLAEILNFAQDEALATIERSEAEFGTDPLFAEDDPSGIDRAILVGEKAKRLTLKEYTLAVARFLKKIDDAERSF